MFAIIHCFLCGFLLVSVVSSLGKENTVVFVYWKSTDLALIIYSKSIQIISRYSASQRGCQRRIIGYGCFIIQVFTLRCSHMKARLTRITDNLSAHICHWTVFSNNASHAENVSRETLSAWGLKRIFGRYTRSSWIFLIQRLFFSQHNKGAWKIAVRQN